MNSIDEIARFHQKLSFASNATDMFFNFDIEISCEKI